TSAIWRPEGAYFIGGRRREACGRPASDVDEPDVEIAVGVVSVDSDSLTVRRQLRISRCPVVGITDCPDFLTCAIHPHELPSLGGDAAPIGERAVPRG